MLNLLDIAYPGRPYRPRIIIDHPIDTVKAPQPVTDTVEAPKNVLDTLTAPLDSLGCKEAVEDTLRSAINFFNDWGSSDGSDGRSGRLLRAGLSWIRRLPLLVVSPSNLVLPLEPSSLLPT